MMLVVGDYGSATEPALAVAAAMRDLTLGRPVDVLVTTGDNFYTDDLASAWELPYGWVADRGIPVWAAWGNHDIESETRVEMMEQTFGPARYYRADWGAVAVVVLDANRPSDPDQLEWLDGQAAELGDQRVIAVFHQPAVSCSKHGPTPDVVDNWQRRFEAMKVDLVLQGHDHNYQHFEVNGMDYVVSGGGGRDLYAIEECADGTSATSSSAEHHFLVLEQTDGGLTLSAIRADGTLIDRFER